MSHNFKRKIKDNRWRRDGNRRHDDSNGSESSCPSNPNRHPPHLRGKAIGLFYAKRQKAMREKEAKNTKVSPKALGTILLSESRKEQIQQLLRMTCKTSAEENTKINSQFKKNFLNMISGNIDDKLDLSCGIKRDIDLDRHYLEEHESRIQSPRYLNLLTKRQQLPSYTKKNEILKLINDNQVVVVSGETGCGKTTQIAQFILDDFVEKGKGSICHVVCTQPRRISAISVAERVADERAESLGWGVGYQIRLEKNPPRDTGSIIFCTTGVVLKQMQSDPCLSKVSHIILDEIHERDVMSDFIIALLKQVITKRKDLKLILMSATLNSEKFSSYYNNCPHINIPGFTFPVKQYYLEDVLERTGFKFEQNSEKRGRVKKNRDKDLFHKLYMEPHIRKMEQGKTYSRDVCIQLRNPRIEEINLELILALVIDICEKEKDQGAILIFLTGYVEISHLNKLFDQSGKFPGSRYLIIPLHSQMPTVNQREVFNRPPIGVRKIILSTNIAETSVTIDDVVFVIDCGKIKMTNFDAETNVSTLTPEWVSLANASQRKGRAGRVQPGVCFHLFTKPREMILEQYQKPEILRTRLENTILTIKILQLGKAAPFLDRLLDSPQPESIKVSLELLKRLNALDENETLTPLGYHLAKLPMGPQVGKMILMGAIFSCLDPVLSVAASLDFKDAFQIPLGKEKQADDARKELSEDSKSDHLLLHYALNRFETEDLQGSKQFCWKYYLSWNTLNLLRNMKRQFMQNLHDMDFVNTNDPGAEEVNRNSNNLSLVKAVICSGLYPNVATIKACKHGGNRVLTAEAEMARMHMKSVLAKETYFESPILVYHLKLRSTAIYIHDGTIIHPLPLIFFGDNYKYNEENEHKPTISISNDFLRFKCSTSTNAIVKELRDRLNWFLELKISNPGVVNWNQDDEETAVLRAVIELITSEDIGDVDVDCV